MADDRYSWLDKGAAERLLRGEPVVAQCAPKRTAKHAAQRTGRTGGTAGTAHPATAEADRLEAALGELAMPRATAPGTAELPGEDAAVAAFRTASAAARLMPGGRRSWRLLGMARPLRAGLAMAIAGCVIGGAVLAAGVGMLSVPFAGGASSTGPSTSVAGTPSVYSTEAAAGVNGRATSLADPGRPGEEPGRTGGSGSPQDFPDAGAGSGQRRGGKPGTATRRDPEADELCRTYRNHRMRGIDRRKLERRAGGRSAIAEFCAGRISATGDRRRGETEDAGSGADNRGSRPGGELTVPRPGTTEPGTTHGDASSGFPEDGRVRSSAVSGGAADEPRVRHGRAGHGRAGEGRARAGAGGKAGGRHGSKAGGKGRHGGKTADRASDRHGGKNADRASNEAGTGRSTVSRRSETPRQQYAPGANESPAKTRSTRTRSTRPQAPGKAHPEDAYEADRERTHGAR